MVKPRNNGHITCDYYVRTKRKEKIRKGPNVYIVIKAESYSSFAKGFMGKYNY